MRASSREKSQWKRRILSINELPCYRVESCATFSGSMRNRKSRPHAHFSSRFRLFSAKSGNFLYFPSSRESPRAVSGGKGRPYDGRVAILLCDGFHHLRTVRPVTPTASLRVSAVDGLGVASSWCVPDGEPEKLARRGGIGPG